AVALQALLNEDRDRVTTLDADGARAFANFVGQLTCRLVTVADAAEAVELVEEAIDTGDGR
ncbi:MAG TPA: hypothetical protein VND92_01410, partial [Vicinamibacterales bacterium]|nr:hypothetical protein [Vicinamibacterales bacterium]